MDKSIDDILFEVPPQADYAVDAFDLSEEDIPQSRVTAVSHLLNSEDDFIRYTAARLLTSWGYEQGVEELEKFEYDNNLGFIDHRLHGYDDSSYHNLRALISFWALNSDRGHGAYAYQRIKPIVFDIINKFNAQPFEISPLLRLIARRRFEEYIPLIKEHLITIIDHPEGHGWKIHDAIELLLKFDGGFVMNLLSEKGKTLKDFNF